MTEDESGETRSNGSPNGLERASELSPTAARSRSCLHGKTTVPAALV